MLRVLLPIAGVIVALVIVVVGVGYALPVGHVASATRTLSQPPERVFAIVSDVARHPQWRTGVKAVTVLGTSPLRWRESGADGEITYVAGESRPPSRFQTRIDDPSLPFGGTWTFDIGQAGHGSTVTITEHGEVYNPMFRFMSRFVFGHTSSIDTYLRSLEAVTSSARDATASS